MAVTISACILARNEEHRIEDALQSLQGWTEQILVIDNESEDTTVAIARRYGAVILTAPSLLLRTPPRKKSSKNQKPRPAV